MYDYVGVNVFLKSFLEILPLYIRFSSWKRIVENGQENSKDQIFFFLAIFLFLSWSEFKGEFPKEAEIKKKQFSSTIGLFTFLEIKRELKKSRKV